MGFRSKSYRDDRLQIESYTGGRVAPTSMLDLRCYSTNDAGFSAYDQYQIGKEEKMHKKSKSLRLSDPELQRKKRVAGYKIYAVEGKMKGSVRKSFKWIKKTYDKAVYGWW